MPIGIHLIMVETIIIYNYNGTKPVLGWNESSYNRRKQVFRTVFGNRGNYAIQRVYKIYDS